MNKTHEELAEAALETINNAFGFGWTERERRTKKAVLTAITAAVQAEREQTAEFVKSILEAENGQAVQYICASELSRLSGLGVTPTKIRVAIERVGTKQV